MQKKKTKKKENQENIKKMTFNQTETKLTTKMWNIRTKWPKRQTKPTHAATKETQNNTKSEKKWPKKMENNPHETKMRKKEWNKK